jgi:hypothetical protein
MRSSIFWLIIKAFFLFAVVIACMRWAAQTLDAHNDFLFWIGITSGFIGFTVLFFGGFWIADSIHKLIQQTTETKK